MKWAREMSNEGLLLKSAIEGVLERRESQKDASVRLWISERQFRRLLQCYPTERQSGLVSKKRGVLSKRKMALSMPGWKTAGQKPLCWSLWMDATSQMLKAEFVPEESFFSYGNLCQRCFREHSLPQAFYSDRFSVFRVNRGDQLRYEPVGMSAHNFQQNWGIK